jgi:LysR family transcriptional activator of glutamate synthase operon
MDIHKFEIFIDLTQTLSYTETAERQFTSQSNVSKQIIALEKELNVSLFERSHRKITLTKSGELLLPYALELVNDYQAMCEALDNQAAKEDRSLSISTIPTLANYQGFGLVTQFMKDHPEISVQLKEAEGNQLFPFLDESRNHLIFARTFDAPCSEYDILLTEEDAFVTVLSKNHPLASQPLIQLADLKDEKFVLLEDSTLLFQPAVDLCMKAGFTPNIQFKSSRIDLLLNMVENELGIALLMKKTIEKNWQNHVEVVPITPTETSYLSFIRKKGNQTNASRQFWNYAKEQLKE